ncbi:MAG: YabP/YqfC family sporulation protein [Christensenellaceae bacterium]
MRLFSYILSKLNADEIIGGGIRYTVLADKSAYFQNVKSMREFSSSRLVLEGRGGGVIVTGKCLTLRSYFGGDLVVNGCICLVENCP